MTTYIDENTKIEVHVHSKYIDKHLPTTIKRCLKEQINKNKTNDDILFLCDIKEIDVGSVQHYDYHIKFPLICRTMRIKLKENDEINLSVHDCTKLGVMSYFHSYQIFIKMPHIFKFDYERNLFFYDIMRVSVGSQLKAKITDIREKFALATIDDDYLGPISL